MTVDLGTYEPKSAIGPSQELDGGGRPTGVTKLGRPTTSWEQREEVVTWMLSRMKPGETSAKVTVPWPSSVATVIEVTARTEHIEGRPVATLERVDERMPNGAEIPRAPGWRAAQLLDEVRVIAEAGDLQ